jgi:death-on-curing protein
MKYLTKDDLLDLHGYSVERYGGLQGIKSQDRLQSVINAPHQAMFGAELYPDLCSKASAMFYLMLKSHPFMGANGVTAILMLLRFLELNDTALHAGIGDTELEWLVRAVNSADLDREGVEQWLRESIRATP